MTLQEEFGNLGLEEKEWKLCSQYQMELYDKFTFPNRGIQQGQQLILTNTPT